MANYEELSKEILKNIGGSDNIESVTHCVTRLRFVLKDDSLAQDEMLKEVDGIVTTMRAGGQFQVVIGNHVPQVYKKLKEIAGISEQTTSSGQKKKMGIGARTIDLISGIMLPMIALLAASGIIKGLNTTLFSIGLYSMESSYYVLINAIGDAIFYFMPAVLGLNTARKLKSNQLIGLLIGLILCYPAINGVDMNFFGLTVNATYTSSVLPVILVVALATPLERFFDKIIPDVIKTFITPILVLLIAVPVGFTLIGPTANTIGFLLADVMNKIVEISPVIAGFVMGALWQVFVMFGVHMMLILPSISGLISGNPDTFMPLMSTVSFAQTAVVIAIWIKTKNKKLKNIALPAWISGIFGVTEPAIYGVTLPRIKMFIISCIGGAIGGAISGFLKITKYTMAGMGIFGLPGNINPQTGSMKDLINSVIAISIAFIVSFVLAMLLYKDDTVESAESNGTTDSKKKLGKIEKIYSPIKGEVIDLKGLGDKAFSEGLLGRGIGLNPSEGKLYAPCDGTIITAFPTKHAIGIVSDEGAEILIHIGLDTVKLDGKYFDSDIVQGQKIVRGELLVSFDMEKIIAEGFSVQTPVVITNSNDYTDIIPMKNSHDTVNITDDILTLMI